MKRVVYHPHASSELAETALFLERREPGLCDEFFVAVTEVEEAICNDHQVGRPYLFGTRRVRAGKFSYAVVFREEPEWVMIYAIASYQREEGYWDERLP